MSIGYGIGGLINVPPQILTGNNPPPSTFVGKQGQQFWDRSTSPNTMYIYNGTSWIAAGVQFAISSASGTAAGGVTLNARAGQATFTSFSCAGGADVTVVLTNSYIAGSTTQILYSLSGVTTGASLSIKSVTNAAGTSTVVITNGTGLTTSVADVTLTYLILT